MSSNRQGGPVGRIVDKIKRTMTNEGDDTRDPLQHGYQRVNTAEGSLSTSTTGTSLDTIVLDTNAEDLNSTPRVGGVTRTFSPIQEADDSTNPFLDPLTSRSPAGESKTKSKSSLKSSRVSFDEEDRFDEGDEGFRKQREHFQKHKSHSTSEHKNQLIKELRHLLAADNRRQFQGKKHVSLDVQSSKVLEELLRASSSEDDFEGQRKQFQERKHKSLDARHITFKFEKEPSPSSSEEDFEPSSSLLKIDADITKPVIIDLKDLESSEDEDYISSRKQFQQAKSMSTDSRKSIRFFEMEMGTKDENIRSAVPFVRQITEEGKPKLEVYRPTTNPIFIWTQVLAALSVSLGSMVVGFSSAYTSPALVSMKDRNITSFEVTDQSGSWVGGIMPLAGLVGGILGGPLIEYLGRKNTILATATPFIISWLLIACANHVAMVLVGRALSGFSVGVASLSLPVYLGETVQPEVRGTLGLLPTAFGNIGILMCFVAGKYMDWSELAFLGAALPVPFLILMFLIPETPRWYVSRGRDDRARKALQWLRGKKADVDPELKGIIKSHQDAERHASKSAMLDLLKKSNLKPLLISLGLMFFQQLSGINAVIFYTVQIFQDAGSTIDENLCTIIVGLVNFIATFIATMLIDRLGRKMLLYISDVAMIITLMTLGGFFYAKNSGQDVSQVGWLPLAAFVIFVLGFSLGFGPIPWLMMGEILPGKIRGSAASVATAFNWSCTFVVTKTFADIIASIGTHGAFWMFGSVCCVGLVFVILYVPETQGKSLEDIERKMMGRVRRMSSVANIKPLSFNM
ncbi:facilitated trehalose transporter Tret1 [Sabethes cyaneus]|uniref:facilitated trehalose transporter Tret1 n=1 Tax=Sabethes cyaneus TaxID=53552 RepID=UPI00237ECB3E|nr:facilitated trehalose transporter Tret1 [Sabethes cyaneus]